MCIGRVHTSIRLEAMRIECELSQSTSGGGLYRIGTKFIVYSSNNNKITDRYAPTNSNIVKALVSRPPYTPRFICYLYTLSTHNSNCPDRKAKY